MRVALLHNVVGEDASESDRDVLVQKQAIHEALVSMGHEPVSIGCTLDLSQAMRDLKQAAPDVVFNLVESLAGTDRLMPAATLLLDVLELPYTGCGTETLLATSNKPAAKERLLQAGLPSAPWLIDEASRITAPAFHGLHSLAQWDRCILKPVWEHASVGMNDDCILATTKPEEVLEVLREKQQETRRPYFAEMFIDGREFNLSVLAGEKGEPIVLPPAEIDFSAYPPGKPRIVGERAKWDVESFEYRGTPRTFDFHPAEVPLLAQLRFQARRCWQAFNLRGYARVDFRIDAQGRPWILEINANPCLAPDAGFAAALDHEGIPFGAAVERILADAFRGTRASESWKA